MEGNTGLGGGKSAHCASQIAILVFGDPCGLCLYFDPKPVSIVRTVRNTIKMSSQGEKYLM